MRLLLVVDESLSAEGVEDARDLSRGFAEFLGEQIAVVTIPAGQVDPVRLQLMRDGGAMVGIVGPAGAAGRAAPMAAAPMVYKADGSPDWGAMWTGYCELALYGGPPHRGDDEALHADPADDVDLPDAAIQEIIRGIGETTGLVAEPAPPGWIAVRCQGRKMAAWLAASIILENVDAHSDGDWLYVPARRDYQLKDQVKSVITVVAKTNHYWQAHIAQTTPAW